MIKKALEKVISEDMYDIWSILSGDEKRMITDNFRLQPYKKNQVIYAENEAPEYLFTLLKGKAKLYKEGAGGRQQILRLISPVQYFGYRAYFAKETYVHTAAAMEASEIGVVPLKVVKTLIEQNKDVMWFFLHELARNLGSADTRTVNLTQKHIRGRLAEALIVLRQQYGYEEDGVTLRMYMSREDLANFSNMTTSIAIRTLTAFVSERLIYVDGRQIKITDEPQLLKISKYG